MGNEKTHITFTCRCGQVIRVPVEKAGSRGRCRACGRSIVVPAPARPRAVEPPPASADYLPPVPAPGLHEAYSEEDLVTYPEVAPVKEQRPPPADVVAEKPSLFAMLGEILRYPVSDKLAMQIFFTGAILFSPLVWKILIIGRYFSIVGCIFDLVVFICIISVRLMYFSYLLLIIEKSAEGSPRIPELPVFQTWEQHLADLAKVIGASAVAFTPYLVYAFSANIEILTKMWESAATGERVGPGVLAGASSSLGMLALLYGIAAFYMPMVLMTMVVTKSFLRAVNPAFIFRSIMRIGREYLTAMLIIFLFLRGSLTVFTIFTDVLDAGWFTPVAANVIEPIIEFYVLVVTMHVTGLLYYRNGDRLNW